MADSLWGADQVVHVDHADGHRGAVALARIEANMAGLQHFAAQPRLDYPQSN
ncbi:MAG: hypothetical protein GYB64_20600 [Chloroflexi bacterium]|nr:hypothetical protein [Chloroflexota bacterium]